MSLSIYRTQPSREVKPIQQYQSNTIYPSLSKCHRGNYTLQFSFSQLASLSLEISVKLNQLVPTSRIDVNHCKGNSQNPTGNQFAGNYTLIGHEALLSDDECLIKQEGGEMVYESMQAIVITTNGWTFQPTTIDLDDVDAEPGVESGDGWKESMAIGRDNPESERCRMTASFTEAIDTLVIMYAVLRKSKTQTRAAAFISERIMKCGCRCSQKDIGIRKLYAPIPGVKGECVEKESTSPRTMCDVLGTTWCNKDDIVGYKPTGDALPNGNCPCVENKGFRVTTDSPFKPRNVFILSTV
ncbi:unnamed protein product [Agarophyton chilense]